MKRTLQGLFAMSFLGGLALGVSSTAAEGFPENLYAGVVYLLACAADILYLLP